MIQGSLIPDIFPKYRLIRHYKKESIDYIVDEIIKVIYIGRYLEFNKVLDPIAINLLSKKIGIISHYLSDFVCLPHARRWTFFNSMVKHIKYETALDSFAKGHSFKRNVIDSSDVEIIDRDISKLNGQIKDYIESVVDEYSLKESFENDLNFALELSLKITYFILDTIKTYGKELHKELIFEI